MRLPVIVAVGVLGSLALGLAAIWLGREIGAPPAGGPLA